MLTRPIRRAVVTRNRLFLLCLATSVSISVSACWTSAETGELLLRRVQTLEESANETRRQNNEQRELLQTEIGRAQTKLQELETILEQATQVVRRANADTGAQVEALQAELQSLQGQLAELRNDIQQQRTLNEERRSTYDRQLKTIARRVGVDMDVEESEIPTDAAAHWQAAELAFNNSEYSQARALFRAFLRRHAQASEAPTAQYRIASSYLREGRPATALGEYRTVLGTYPQSAIVDRTLFDMAECFWQLHACTDVRTSLRALLRSYPRSTLVREARSQLRRVQNAPEGYCTN